MTYDELIAGGEPAIFALVGRQETLQLEFKANDAREPIFQDGVLNRSGRKLLAKEISAFSNSAGGLMVFGVSCRPVDGVDEVDNVAPIANIDRAETSVRDAAAELLQPRHDGIRVAAIRATSQPDCGYLLVDVPRSDRRPHRSEATDQKYYYKRSGTRSYPMEHYDIEDAFKRISSPSLKIEVSYRSSMIVSPDEHHFEFQLAIENTSDVTAKMISLQIWNRSGVVFGHDDHAQVQMKLSSYNGRLHLAGPMDFVIHPGEKRLFYDYGFVARTTPTGGVTFFQNRLAPGSIRFDYCLSADNMRMRTGAYELSEEEMINFARIFSAAQERKARSGL